jgi:hypothetical protein
VYRPPRLPSVPPRSLLPHPPLADVRGGVVESSFAGGRWGAFVFLGSSRGRPRQQVQVDGPRAREAGDMDLCPSSLSAAPTPP